MFITFSFFTARYNTAVLCLEVYNVAEKRF